jgi:tRNA G18 (ribose-2'-O)-methylase SpoU
MIVILDSVRSVHNVGSIFRTCDAAGVSKLVLCGITPTPLDRFGRTRNDLAKVALGAETSVSWEYVSDIRTAIEQLKKEGIQIVAVEQSSQSVDYKILDIKNETAFVFGNEVEGISNEILTLCDSIVEIPMRGEKESLNVGVTVGIILFMK